MTSVGAFFRRPEHLSVLAVIATTLVAVALGWQVRAAVVEATRAVEVGRFRCEVPADWLVQEGFGDLVLVARSPARELPLYTVSQLASAGPLHELAELRTAERRRSLTSYEVVEVESASEGERRSHRVRFAYLDETGEGLRVLVEGVDEYFALGDAVVVASLEADAGTLEEAMPAFGRFVDSIEDVPGEDAK